MSENRFWFVIDKGKLEYVQDNVTNETITVTELEDLLNELHEENQQLKNDCSILVQSNQEYRKENDDLRFALRTEQAFTRVEKDKKPFLSKEEFLKELKEDE